MKQVLRNANYAYSRALLDQIFDDLKKYSIEKGYAIAVHGSLKKDIDIILVPWVNYPIPADDFMDGFLSLLNDIFGAACFCGDVGIKPHGRRAYTIVCNGSNVYFDVSIIEPKDLSEGKE